VSVCVSDHGNDSADQRKKRSRQSDAAALDTVSVFQINLN